MLDVLWEGTHGPDADFYKGLIQASICLHHLTRDNVDGARKLYSGHRRYLAPYLPHHRGVDVERLLVDMQAYLRPILRARPDERPALDREHRPRIVFVGG